MKTLSIITSMLLVGTSISIHAASIHLLDPLATDLAPEHIDSFTAPKSAIRVDRQAVQYSRQLSTETTLTDFPAPFVKKSRSYFEQVSLVELAKGVSLHSNSPGAVVRLTPVGKNKFLLQIADISLRNADQSLRLVDAAITLADSDQLKAAGADFGTGTLAFRIKPALGSGPFELRSNAAPTASKVADASIFIHVYEPESKLSLQLTTDRMEYAEGMPMHITASFSTDTSTPADIRLTGFVSTPGSRTRNLQFMPAGAGRFAADLLHDATFDAMPGLWSVHVFARGQVNQTTIYRDANTAFASVLASARLTGTAEVQRNATGLSVHVPIQVGRASRFGLRGVLRVMGKHGEQRAAWIAESAAWLDAGAQELTLAFPEAAEFGAKQGARFELHHLELRDQGRLSLLHRQARALAFSWVDARGKGKNSP